MIIVNLWELLGGAMSKIHLESIFTDRTELCREIEQNQDLSAKLLRLVVLIFLSAGCYGFIMGFEHSFAQAISSLVKVPLLFFLSLFICIPTLHFIGLLLGSSISFRQSVLILLIGIAVNSVLLLSFAPIIIFFLLAGSFYLFILYLHVVVFIISGLAGLKSIYDSFVQLGKNNKPGFLKIWMLLYMFVGTQTAFILAPFIGKQTEFHVFHHPSGNFYSYLYEQLAYKWNDELPPTTAKKLIAQKAHRVVFLLNQQKLAELAEECHRSSVKFVLGSENIHYGIRFLPTGLVAEFTSQRKYHFGKRPVDKNKSAGGLTFQEFFRSYLQYPFADGQVFYNSFSETNDVLRKKQYYLKNTISVQYLLTDQQKGNWQTLTLLFKKVYNDYQLQTIIFDSNRL